MTSSYSSSLKIVKVFERDEIHRKLSRKSEVIEPVCRPWQRQLMYGAEGLKEQNESVFYLHIPSAGLEKKGCHNNFQ